MARFTAQLLLLLAVALAAVAQASAKVYFEEKFDDSWEKRWKKSTWKVASGEAGSFTLTAGKWYDDPVADRGIQTGPDARFYATYAEMPGAPFSNEGKPLVLQFSVKHEQKLDCGGGYIKLLPASSGPKMADFGGDTPYALMFGPDVCGTTTKRVHNIITYKGKNLLTKKHIECETDQLTHVYTLIIQPNNTYSVLVDNKQRAEGSLEEDWDFLAPKTIKDPSAVKPADWDERPMIDDPEDSKPADWVDGPKQIADEKATKPEDWDEEDDGEWEPPMVDNPAYKGEWKAKKIDNPAYKGVWVAPDIPNPEYEADDQLYLLKDLKYVGFELWQVKAGSLFDNVLVTDDVAYAAKFAEETWGKSKDGEKEMFDQEEEKKNKEEEEARAAADAERKAAESKAKGDDDADDDDEDDDDDVLEEEAAKTEQENKEEL